MSLDGSTLETALRRVSTPDGGSLVDSGRLTPIAIGEGGRVSVAIHVDRSQASRWEATRRAAEVAITSVPGVSRALVTLTSERPAEAVEPPGPARSATGAAVKRFPSLAEVRHIVAVASGKGGVGKSTTATNLALALAARGRKVGVLDADIYGPSMPKLFALKGKPRIISGRTLAPMEAYGCKVMSIGFIVDAGKAMVWRGPMVASAITQMLRDVAWGALDVLIVDMPPGTGDAQLTMAQQTPLSGAVIVSTPQDLALIDARRGVSMFQDVGVPILGIVENMSYFVCDQCGKRHDVFAHGGARAEAAKLGVPFLGEVPLDIEIRERSDAGLPIVVTAPDGAHATRYGEIADAVWRQLSERS